MESGFTMLDYVLPYAFVFALLLAATGIQWVAVMCGFVLLGPLALLAIAILWTGAVLMRSHMARQRISRHGTPARVRVLRVENNSLLVGEDFLSCALTVEVLGSGPRRTITFTENLDVSEVPEIGEELEVLFDPRSPDLAIIRRG